MLDAFKNMSGNKGKAVDKQTSELELLIATAREERSAIGAMLTALTTRSAKLTPLTQSMEQADADGDGRHRPGSTASPTGSTRWTIGPRSSTVSMTRIEALKAAATAGRADHAENHRTGR